MELTVLRSSLQHACDINNLTCSDLQEGKWVTKRKVFLALYSTTKILEEYYEQLLDLIDNRNEEINRLKAANVIKEKRLETEQCFRTNFMRVILSGLSHLRWPPTLEAFSDPIDLLFNDNDAVLSAYAHILQIAMPGSLLTSAIKSDKRAATKRPAQRPHENPDEFEHPQLSSRLGHENDQMLSGRKLGRDYLSERLPIGVDGDGDLSTVHPLSNHSQENLRDSVHSTTADGSGTSRNEPVAADLDFDGDSYAPSCRNNTSGRISGVPSVAAPSSSWHDQTSSFSSMQYQPPKEKLPHEERRRPSDIRRRAFEVLQRQNELLSGQLYELKASIRRRDEAECRMTAVVSQLRSAIEDITSVGVTSTTTSTTTATATDCAGSTAAARGGDCRSGSSIKQHLLNRQNQNAFNSDGILSPEERFEFEAEVRKEEQLEKESNNKTLGLTTQQRNNYSNNTTGARSKNLGDYARTATTGSAADSSSSSSSNVCELCGSSKNWGPSQSQSKTPHSTVVWQQLLRKVQALESEWIAAQRATQAMANQSSGNSEVVLRIISSGGMTPSQRLAHAQCGAGTRPIATIGITATTAAATETDSSREQQRNAEEWTQLRLDGLDLSRLHLLQKDLVAFAEAAFTYSNKLMSNSGIEGSSSSTSTSSSSCENEKHLASKSVINDELLQLQESADSLLLHLAFIAPVAPLSISRASPLDCSINGIEALIEQASIASTRRTIGTGAGLSRKMQQQQAEETASLRVAADRALGEQVALVRCLQRSRSALQQWVQHSTQHVLPLMRKLGSGYRSAVQQAHQRYLRPLRQAISSIVKCVHEAEYARVPASNRIDVEDCSSSSSSSSSQPNATPRIAPLDSLARGAAGSAVATLVTALRMHIDDLEHFESSINEMASSVYLATSGELNTLMNIEAAESRASAATRAEIVSQDETLLRAAQESFTKNTSNLAGAGFSDSNSSQDRSRPRSARSSERRTRAKAVAAAAPRPPFDLSFA